VRGHDSRLSQGEAGARRGPAAQPELTNKDFFWDL